MRCWPTWLKMVEGRVLTLQDPFLFRKKLACRSVENGPSVEKAGFFPSVESSRGSPEAARIEFFRALRCVFHLILNAAFQSLRRSAEARLRFLFSASRTELKQLKQHTKQMSKGLHAWEVSLYRAVSFFSLALWKLQISFYDAFATSSHWILQLHCSWEGRRGRSCQGRDVPD